MKCDSPPVSIERGDTYVCLCMRVTHADLLEAIACRNARTLTDLRRDTGAGDGCMACHRRLRCYLPVAEQVVS